MRHDVLSEILEPADSTIVLLVLDGLGGLPDEGTETTLEAAETPNFDQLAASAECGLQVPVGTGIIPGSGPGHLGLFGYDPLEYRVGRGVLSALGIGFDLHDGDVAARGNFCTVDEEGVVTDRRAGRISTETNEKLCEKLSQIELPGVDVFVETVKEHRFLLALRGNGLVGDIHDTDPHEVGHPADPARPKHPEAERTADLVANFVRQANELLADEEPANSLLLRGFDSRPDWPRFPQAYGLDAACVASYPMYKGVSKLVGMEVLEADNPIEKKFELVGDRWEDYDFFFIHEKGTDSSGEDGDFERKRETIEEVDRHLPKLLDLDPDVLFVTGDHSTPAVMKQHSWHPVPVLMSGPNVRPDGVEQFGERPCTDGALGPQFPARDLMALALANAGRLTKYGA